MSPAWWEILSEVRLYDSVLTSGSSSQVSSLFNNQEPANAGCPAAEWRLNQSGGTNVPGNYGNNMVETSATVYDYGGVGDGNVTETLSLPDDAATPANQIRVTQTYYDWQDRQVATKTGALVSYTNDSGGITLNVNGFK